MEDWNNGLHTFKFALLDFAVGHYSIISIFHYSMRILRSDNFEHLFDLGGEIGVSREIPWKLRQ